MARDHTTLTIHGLDEDNKLVRADVLAQKLQALIRGLRAADVLANGKITHQFIVTEMHVSSAVFQVREKQTTHGEAPHSTIPVFEKAVQSVYQGDKGVARLPTRLVSSIAALSSGAKKRFAHGEVGEGENIVRVDEYLFRQSVRAKESVKTVARAATVAHFNGMAVSSFDGTLQLLDSRGTVLLTKLTLTGSRQELDCIVNKDHIPEFSQYFEKRVRVEGRAHYNGRAALPERVDAVKISAIKAQPNLLRWRGAFEAAG